MGILGDFASAPGADGLMQGAKLGANLAGMWQSSYDESYDRQRRDSARDAFGKAWASGDQSAVDRVMQQFPEFAQEAQKFIGIRDEQHRKDLGSLMSKISAMAQSGDYQGILNVVDKNGRVLDADSSALLKNAANTAIHADDKTSAAVQQALMQSTDAIAKVALTPRELSDEKLRQQQQEETAWRDREAHEDRIAGRNERAMYHNQMLNLRSQMGDKQQEIADRMNWNSWGTNNRDTIKRLGTTMQAESRMEAALNSGTPIGDVSAMLQFMVQEAPNLSPRIAQAMGISDESASGLIARAQRSLQDAATGKKLLPQQVSDLKSVGAAMKQAVQNQYYSVVSPALVGVDLSDPKQAQTAMKRTNLPLSALNHIQQNADDYDQLGFGSGITGGAGTNNGSTGATPPAPNITPLSNNNRTIPNPYTGEMVQGRTPAGMENTGIPVKGNVPDGTINQNKPDYVAYNGYWYKKAGKK